VEGGAALPGFPGGAVGAAGMRNLWIVVLLVVGGVGVLAAAVELAVYQGWLP
jgi:hypothetical protein